MKSRERMGCGVVAAPAVIFIVAALAALIGAVSCTAENGAGSGEELAENSGNADSRASGSVDILLTVGNGLTKSESPDEELVTDLNLFLFNSYGLMEDKIYLGAGELSQSYDGSYRCSVQMLVGNTYSIYACANTGFELSFSNLEELLAYRYYLAYPDDYRIGVPMSAKKEKFTYKGESSISLPLVRTMAKVSISIDRSALNSDVTFTVTRVTVGNCPKSVLMFDDNVVSGTDDTYTVGFRRSEDGVDNLNRNASGRVSGEVSLYMFENMQGSPLGDITDYAEKEFDDNDFHKEQCSYIELVASYDSDEYYSLPGEGLIYRFYLGESASDFNVQRNCHYHIVLRPEGTGLEGSGWRVDKSAITYGGPTSITVSPGNYIRGKIGDIVDVRVTLVPDYAPFDIGLEELRYDKERGIYDYAIHSDGMGVTLTLTGSGTGLLYFEAGAPINDAALVIVEVDLP